MALWSTSGTAFGSWRERRQYASKAPWRGSRCRRKLSSLAGILPKNHSPARHGRRRARYRGNVPRALVYSGHDGFFEGWSEAEPAGGCVAPPLRAPRPATGEAQDRRTRDQTGRSSRCAHAGECRLHGRRLLRPVALFGLSRSPGELDLTADQVAIDTGDKARRRLTAARRVAAVVEADVALPLQVVALEVVVDAEGHLRRLLVAAEGVVVEPHAGRPARRGGGDAQGGPLCGSQVDERAVATDVGALTANPRVPPHQLQFLRDHEVAGLHQGAEVDEAAAGEQGHLVQGVAASVIDVVQDGILASGSQVFLAAKVLEVPQPPVVQQAEAAPLAGSKRLVGVRVEGVHREGAAGGDAGNRGGHAAAVEDAGDGAAAVGRGRDAAGAVQFRLGVDAAPVHRH